MLKILDKLESGEHLYINGWEIFMNYIGTFWIRKEMYEDGEQYWHQEYFETLEQVLEKVGIVTQKQISLF